MSAFVAFIAAASVGDMSALYNLRALAEYESVAAAAVESAKANGHHQAAAAIKDKFMF